MNGTPGSNAPRVITIPSGDEAFSRITQRLLRSADAATPDAFERRLRRTFPRAVVRRREIAGEPTSWYVYRDGGWRSSLTGSWWEAPDLPRLAITADGFLADANATALGLLEIEPADLDNRHYTDFVVPGTLEDSIALFDIVNQGSDLTATLLLRPTSGHIIAVDVHAWREGDRQIAVLRLADDVPLPARPLAAEPQAVTCLPETDAAFRGYVSLALSRMPEPTPDGLALRLRRLYPHAEVVAADSHWLARREPETERSGTIAWWTDPTLPLVRYDAQALIVDANEAAESLLGRSLVGHHWQEFVTPGSTEQVSAMLAILAEVGRAESRFRMPRADGSLLEFDSYTEVDGESYFTVMRPRSPTQQ